MRLWRAGITQIYGTAPSRRRDVTTSVARETSFLDRRVFFQTGNDAHAVVPAARAATHDKKPEAVEALHREVPIPDLKADHFLHAASRHGRFRSRTPTKEELGPLMRPARRPDGLDRDLIENQVPRFHLCTLSHHPIRIPFPNGICKPPKRKTPAPYRPA